MIPHETFPQAPGRAFNAAPDTPTPWLHALAAGVRAWFTTGSDYYRAAVMYEELSSLAGAERAGRRMSRAALARELCKACDRTEASRAA
jgi:hypothetical protein